jgi:hypothetical protein
MLFAVLRLLAATNAVYISQSGGGAGTSCGSAQAASYFNNSGNWSASPTGIQIGPGTTVHICGTITTTLTFQGSGVSGNVITLLAESGAALSQPAGNLVNLNGQGYLLLDGGTNGVMQNTANGENLSYHTPTQAIQASGASNIEVRNWTMSNMYVAVAPNTNTVNSGFDEGLSSCYSANGYGGTISIHDNVMHDNGWCVTMGDPSFGAVVNVYNNNVYNTNHCFTVNSAEAAATISIHDNQCHDTANWDSYNDSYHHDGVHIFSGSQPGSSWAIYNNYFYGNWGANNTAHIFTEDTPYNVTIFNNVFVQYPGDVLNDGFIAMENGSSYNAHLFNNVFVGDGTTAGLPFGIRITSSGGAIIENNAFNSLNNFISLPSGFLGVVDYNQYGIQTALGGNGAFNWEASGGTNSFSTWQSECGCDSDSAWNMSGIGIGSTGQPLSGSPLIGAGLNLTSLMITALDAGTTAGRTVTPTAQPSMGSWTVGAYGSTASAVPIVSLSPTPTLAFGSINTMATASLTETLSNIGSATLTGSIAITTGTYFSITGGTCSTTMLSVAASGSCTVIVQFAPTVAAAETDHLIFTTNAATSPDSITLTGTGVATAPVVSLNHATLAFGNVTDGSSGSLTETLTNNGNATMTGSVAVTTGTYYSITGGTCNTSSLSVSASGSCTVIVQYAPTVARSVAIDAVGPSSAGQGCIFAGGWTGPVTCTWAHTIGSGANPLIVGVNMGILPDSCCAASVTYDGMNMLAVPSSIVHANATNAGYLQEFEMINPPSGTHNVVVTIAGSSASQLTVVGGSISFKGSYGPTILSSATGQNNLATITATGGTASGLFEAMAAAGSALSAPTQTGQWLNNYSGSSGAGNAGMQTATAGVNSIFSYSILPSADYWGILSVLIAPGDGDTLVFTTNAASSPDTVVLTGTGTAASIASPTNLQIFELQ